MNEEAQNETAVFPGVGLPGIREVIAEEKPANA